MIRIRGHHLLCLHGFKGHGYSTEFVDNMALIRDRLRSSPEIIVKVLNSPDDICAACPHLSGDGCIHRDQDSEVRVKDRDSIILKRLSLLPGNTLPSGSLFTLAAETFGNCLSEICSSCRWFPQGWCEEGLQEKSMSPYINSF